MKFEGFCPETFDFLWGIRMNNNRDWFMANKPQYVQKLYEPMKVLGKELFEPFMDRPGNLLKVSRIYRDARLHHPDPYKESLWICIRQDVQWWAENPCLFFEIRPEGVSYGLFIWKLRPTVMEQFRRELAADPEPFLQMVEDVERATGLTVTANTYKRPKAVEDPRLERFFAWKDTIECSVVEEPGEDLFSGDLKDRVAELFEKLLPLYDYFNRFKV